MIPDEDERTPDIEPRHGYGREMFTDHQHFDSAQDLACRTVTPPYSSWPTACCMAAYQHQPHTSPDFAIEHCLEEGVDIRDVLSRR